MRGLMLLLFFGLLGIATPAKLNNYQDGGGVGGSLSGSGRGSDFGGSRQDFHSPIGSGSPSHREPSVDRYQDRGSSQGSGYDRRTSDRYENRREGYDRIDHQGARPSEYDRGTEDRYSNDRRESVVRQGSRDRYEDRYETPDPYEAPDPYEEPERPDPYEAPERRDPYEAPDRRDPYEAPERRDPYETPERRDPYKAPERRDPYDAQDRYSSNHRGRGQGTHSHDHTRGAQAGFHNPLSPALHAELLEYKNNLHRELQAAARAQVVPVGGFGPAPIARNVVFRSKDGIVFDISAEFNPYDRNFSFEATNAFGQPVGGFLGLAPLTSSYHNERRNPNPSRDNYNRPHSSGTRGGSGSQRKSSNYY